MKALQYLFKNSRPNLYKNSTVSLLLPLGAFADMGKFELQFLMASLGKGCRTPNLGCSLGKCLPIEVGTQRTVPTG